MQAGGAYVWGHEKFRDLNAKIQTTSKYVKDEENNRTYAINVSTDNSVSVRQWFLANKNGNTIAQPVQGGNGKIGRYVYDKNHRNWRPLEQLQITGARNTETDMGSIEGFVSFLKAGQELEKKLYPDGNVRRILILVDHGGGIRGICVDEYTKNMLSLKEIHDAFKQVNSGWTNPDEKPFEVVAFDACIMSVYETAVAVKDAANYMVASQESTFGKTMFGYTDLLNKLSKNPSMSGKELGRVICTTTWEDSKVTDKEFNTYSNNMFTESVIDLSEEKMNALQTAYENFSEESSKLIRQNPDDIVYTFAKFKNAANSSERFPLLGGVTPEMVDLKNFASNVRDTFPELKNVSEELVKAVDNSVVYNKRGNAFKRGGGISVYYPFDLQSYPNLAGYLSSESSKEFYRSLHDNMQGRSVDLSNLKLKGVGINEENNSVSVELSEDELKNVANVRYKIFFIAENDNTKKMEALFLGNESDVEIDRPNGTFRIHFNGKKLLALNGNPMAFQVVSDATRKNKDGKKVSGQDICVSNILLNGNPYKLFFARNYPNEKITVIGAVPTNDGTATLPSDELESLKKGDVITPLYIHVHDEKANYAKFKSTTIGDNPKFEMFSIKNGVFGYVFEFVNPVDDEGNVATKEGAVCKFKDGKIVKVIHSDYFDDLSDLES